MSDQGLKIARRDSPSQYATGTPEASTEHVIAILKPRVSLSMDCSF